MTFYGHRPEMEVAATEGSPATCRRLKQAAAASGWRRLFDEASERWRAKKMDTVRQHDKRITSRSRGYNETGRGAQCAKRRSDANAATVRAVQAPIVRCTCPFVSRQHTTGAAATDVSVRVSQLSEQ